MSDVYEEKVIFQQDSRQLSSRTLSFYGTHQRENKSKILYSNGCEFIPNEKYGNLKAKYIFHVCFQLSSIIDYVSN